MKTALTIAGSDSSGGAGIQADLKTMTMLGVYAMSAIAALTAQNTTGVSEILEVSPHFLEAQLDSIFTDIFPDAVKIGMLSSAELMKTTAAVLKKYKARQNCGCTVLCKGGHKTEDASDLLYINGKAIWIPGKRIDNPNTHGTGCTLSSAIASGLAKGLDLEAAVREAKAYVTGALEAGLDLGKGSGPLWHNYRLFS